MSQSGTSEGVVVLLGRFSLLGSLLSLLLHILVSNERNGSSDDRQSHNSTEKSIIKGLVIRVTCGRSGWREKVKKRYGVPSPVASGGALSESDRRVDKGKGVGHASADIVEVSADEEMIVAGLQRGISDELELESVLSTLVDDVIVSQASQL